MIELTVLGTGSMVPTKERNVVSVYAEHKGVGILFDCGEGTQRQMNIAGINRTKVRYIFLSHWHADHMSGLLGLLQTICNSKESEIDIFGPKGTKEHMNHLLKASIFDNRLRLSIKEIIPKKVERILKTSGFSVYAAPLEHGIPCVGYKLVEHDTRRVAMSKLHKQGVIEGPWIAELQQGNDMTYKGKIFTAKEYTSVVEGKSFAYVTDTLFVQSAVDLADSADVLICEATFVEHHSEKAAEFHHMTAQQAAQIASMASVGKLILFHFSQRYKTSTVSLEEAQAVFPETEIGYDFMKVKIK